MTASYHPPRWQTSSYSGQGGENCVEVAPVAGGVLVRHSKRPGDGTIEFSHPAWAAFVAEVRAGLPSDNGAATTSRSDEAVVLRSLHAAVTLRFDHDEWSAFVAGTQAGEFTFPAPAAAF